MLNACFYYKFITKLSGRLYSLFEQISAQPYPILVNFSMLIPGKAPFVRIWQPNVLQINAAHG
jgi:hypothetical protein